MSRLLPTTTFAHPPDAAKQQEFSMKRFFANLFAGSKNTTSPLRKVFRPSIEGLETRCCPAVVLEGTGLVITGTAKNDVVEIIEDHSYHNAGLLQVIDNGKTYVFKSAQVEKIMVDLGDGSNSFTYRLGGNSDFTRARQIGYTGGDGFDTVAFYLANNGWSLPAAINAPLAIAVNTKGGVDAMEFRLGTVNSEVDVRVQLGDARDRFMGILEGDINGASQVQLSVDGGRSDDEITVWATHDVDIAPDALLDIAMNGSGGSDRLEFAYRGELDGRLNVMLDGGANNDIVISLITLDHGSKGALNARLYGGAGNDTMALQIRDRSEAEPEVQGLLDGGAGDRDIWYAPKKGFVQVENAEVYEPYLPGWFWVDWQ